MCDQGKFSTMKLNLSKYRDKVLGCWTGKNVGGTIGAPFEWDTEMNDVTFYTQDLSGKPAPNDDLDLQLIWLLAAERNGVYHLNERIMGEHWLSYIVGPWNEYGVCKANLKNGFYPPLSGSCNNDKWKYSNGAWIRSEIWACLFPGSPDEAARFARLDACCDHCGEGIYAEMFTASMQSAAFIENDIRKLITCGLARIPSDCRIARSVKLACELYDKGTYFVEARNAIVKDSADLGWFQAPGNIGFVILALLYSEGDFGRGVSLATNCGDDTDCTAGTVGALMGIILGRSGIPHKWTEPIGESIQTCSIITFGNNHYSFVPATVNELTDRVIRLAKTTWADNPALPELVDGESVVEALYIANLSTPAPEVREIWEMSPYELAFELPYGKFCVDYEDGPYVVPHESKKLSFMIDQALFIENIVSVKLLLPEGWRTEPSREYMLNAKHTENPKVELLLIPGEFDGAVYYLPVELRLSGRFNPITVNIPLQRLGSVDFNPPLPCNARHKANQRHKLRNLNCNGEAQAVA